MVVPPVPEQFRSPCEIMVATELLRSTKDATRDHESRQHDIAETQETRRHECHRDDEPKQSTASLQEGSYDSKGRIKLIMKKQVDTKRKTAPEREEKTMDVDTPIFIPAHRRTHTRDTNPQPKKMTEGSFRDDSKPTTAETNSDESATMRSTDEDI